MQLEKAHYILQIIGEQFFIKKQLMPEIFLKIRKTPWLLECFPSTQASRAHPYFTAATEPQIAKSDEHAFWSCPAFHLMNL
jgi:hypothetical protein